MTGIQSLVLILELARESRSCPLASFLLALSSLTAPCRHPRRLTLPRRHPLATPPSFSPSQTSQPSAVMDWGDGNPDWRRKPPERSEDDWGGGNPERRIILLLTCQCPTGGCLCSSGFPSKLENDGAGRRRPPERSEDDWGDGNPERRIILLLTCKCPTGGCLCSSGFSSLLGNPACIFFRQHQSLTLPRPHPPRYAHGHPESDGNDGVS